MRDGHIGVAKDPLLQSKVIYTEERTLQKKKTTIFLAGSHLPYPVHSQSLSDSKSE